MSNIMPEPGRHGWVELLTLVGAVRRIAHDRTIEPDDALRRIRDAFHEYDHQAASVSYEIMPGRCRALCCVCGTCRTYSPKRRPGRYVSEGFSPEQLARGLEHESLRRGMEHYVPWHRVLGDLKCATCGKITQHALLRDDPVKDEYRTYAEQVNYGLARR